MEVCEGKLGLIAISSVGRGTEAPARFCCRSASRRIRQGNCRFGPVFAPCVWYATIADGRFRYATEVSQPGGAIMNPLLYLKAVVGAVGANVFPPLADWGVSFIDAPSQRAFGAIDPDRCSADRRRGLHNSQPAC